jgi:hypothetical protein
VTEDRHFILVNGEVVPCDVLTWGRWFQRNQDRFIAKTSLGHETMSDVVRENLGIAPTSCEVSTVFLGVDHSFGEGPPLIFETLVFGGPLDQEMERYSTMEQALAGHEAMVERVRDAYREKTTA